MSGQGDEAREIPPEMPFWDRSVTLGEVRGGTIRFTHAIAGKSAMLECRHGAALFVAWTGRHTTDIFVVTEKDVAAFKRARGMSAT